jgi:hypothetical protein
MPTDRSEYQIGIKTTADSAGIKEAKDGLKGVGQAAEELGASAKKGGEGVEEMVGGHHGIHAIGHALNEAMPGLLQFTRFLTSGFTAAVGGALLAFEFLKGKIEDFNKALDELNTGPGARGEWAEKIADNTRAAAVETAVFTERLRELQERQDGLAQSTDRLIATQHSHASDAQSLANAQKELQLAQVALAEKLGEITPEQAVLIRLQIDDAAFKREIEAKKAEIQAELSARQQELNANENREPQLRAAKERADAAALAAENAQAKNSSKLEQDKKNLADIQEAQKKNEEWLLGHAGPMSEYGPDRLEKHTREKAGESFERQIAGLSTSIHQEEVKAPPLAATAAVAKQQAEAAKADYEEAAKLSHDVLETVNKLKADLAAATARNDALENIHRQTSQVQAASAHRGFEASHGPCHCSPGIHFLPFADLLFFGFNSKKLSGTMKGVQTGNGSLTPDILSKLDHLAGLPAPLETNASIKDVVVSKLNSRNRIISLRGSSARADNKERRSMASRSISKNSANKKHADLSSRVGYSVAAARSFGLAHLTKCAAKAANIANVSARGRRMNSKSSPAMSFGVSILKPSFWNILSK